MRFLKTIPHTVYDPKFYKSLLTSDFSSAFKLYVKVACLVAGIVAIISSSVAVPAMSFFVKESKGWIASTFPEDLVIEIKQGEASSSYKTPYTIPLKSDWNLKEDDANAKLPANLLVIDTSKDLTLDEFIKSDTYSYLSKNYLVHFDDQSVVFQRLKEFPDITITKALLSKIANYGSFLSVILPIMFFAGALASFAGGLFWLAVLALIFLLITKLFRNNLTYLQSYIICIHASIVPGILNVFLFYTNFRIPFIFSLVTLLIAIINTKSEPIQETLPTMGDDLQK